MISDQQLIQASLKGEQSPFRTLVLRYQDKMYSVCMSILKNPAEAQEATQDTFFKAHRALENYNADSKFSSWLYKIAYRTSLDYLRKRKSTSDIDQLNGSQIVSSENRQLSLDNKELSGLLSQAIAQLNEEEALIVRLFYLEELQISELEDITGLGKSNIKVKLFRARKKLADIIKSDYSELQQFLIV